MWYTVRVELGEKSEGLKAQGPDGSAGLGEGGAGAAPPTAPLPVPEPRCAGAL